MKSTKMKMFSRETEGSRPILHYKENRQNIITTTTTTAKKRTLSSMYIFIVCDFSNSRRENHYSFN